METCKNWYHERWDELFRYDLPYQPPVHEDFHVCLGSQDSGGHVDACYVRFHALSLISDLIETKQVDVCLTVYVHPLLGDVLHCLFTKNL